MKSYTQEQITEIVGGILSKIQEAKIEKIAPPLLSDVNTLALALNEEEIENLTKTQAKVALVPLGINLEHISTIEVERPKLAMMKLLHLFYVPPELQLGIHPTAIIHPTAEIDESVAIGANVVISRGVKIDKGVKILPNCYFGRNVQIGENSFFHAGCHIGDDVKIGKRVILQQGCSIGADGFSFVTENPDNIEKAKQDGAIKDNNTSQKIYKIPSIGSVIIEDDVEIGANSAVDRGTIENTVIGASTKIDNLVQIGHNCKIGRGCMIVSQAGVAGSCVIGDRVVIAGQAGLADHLKIGSDSIIMAQAGVTKSFPDKSIIVGAPAVPRKEFIKGLKTMKSAEALVEKFKKYEHLLDALDMDETK